MGGADNVLTLAKAAFDQGEYRWVAEVVNHIIFADPDSTQINPQNQTTANAKLLQADALEQMGYQAESGPWRNVYLMGAHELRHGVSPALQPHPLSNAVMSAMTLDQYFDYMGLRFNAPKAQAKPGFIPRSTINWIVMNPNALPQFYALELMDFTLPYTSYEKESELPANPDCTVTLERQTLNEITTDPNLTIAEAFELAVAQNKIVVKGDQSRVMAILELLDIFPANFNIVTPGQIQDAV
jgi:alkyl sulfatase BDS1-like metallo-beta-lactamase superfamily hydrolase